MKRHRTGLTGLTLVELMIVIGIIAILVGILLPAVARARATARVAVCTSNLHQIDTALRTWSLNYNQMKTPGSGWPTSVQKVINEGRVTINENNGADRIMTCPDMDPTYSVTTTVTTIPAGTDPPNLLVEFEKNNGGHPVTWVQNSLNQWTATEVYQKTKPNYATFVFTRVGTTNNWDAKPTREDPWIAGVGPPLSLYSVYDNKLYPNVLVGSTYRITGPPITPVTTTTVNTIVSTSYGINVAVTGKLAPKSGRVLIMDYNQSTADYTTDSPATFLVGRHYKQKMHNVLMTDGSIQLLSLKQLSFTATPNLYVNK